MSKIFKNKNKSPKPGRNKYELSLKDKKRKLLFSFLLMMAVVLIIIGIVIFALLFGNGANKTPNSSTNPDANSTTPSDSNDPATTAPPPSAITFDLGESILAPRIFVYDMDSKSVISSKNADEKASSASLTKIATAILLIKHSSADEVFTVGPEQSFVMPDSSSANLKVGYQLSRDDLLHGIMLPSGNDASFLAASYIGKKVGGSKVKSESDAVQYFVEMMNSLAAEIGATNTHFVNPNGFDHPNQYSTARDIAIFTESLLTYPELKAIAGKASSEHTILSGEQLKYTNSNLLLQNGNYKFDGITGCKTGTTADAGNCVSASATRNGRSVIVVVMGAETRFSCYDDAYSLLNKTYELIGAM